MPILDRAALLSRYGDRPDFIARLLAAARHAHADTAADLRAAIDQRDWSRLTALAHTVEATAGSLASASLQDL
ncbi:hypothetical protein ABTM87_19800, partial [Acinetobacter baumannii]